MTLFGDLAFFLYLAAICLPAVALGLAGRPIRWYGTAASALTIVLVLAPSRRQLALLVLFVTGQLLLASGHAWFVRHRGRAATWERRAVVIAALLPLLAAKISGVVQLPSVGFLGVSYLTFRAVQVILEISDGLIERIRPWHYVYFLSFFPAVSAGPIDRSRRFDQDADNPPGRSDYTRLLGQGLWYLVLGAAYKFGPAAWCEYFLRDPDVVGAGILPYMYLYGFELYFDFAGYSLMAVGASYVFGVRTPLNFRAPFVAESIKDFWNRWHITLSFWLRDYLFSRLTMAFIRRKVFADRVTAARVGFVVNMAVMGFWHGTSPQYVFYGIYHGVLMVLNDVYERRSGFHQRHRRATWYRVVSILVTFHAVMFGFLIFSGRLPAA
jgi:membrane protein involved in D-alanine export